MDAQFNLIEMDLEQKYALKQDLMLLS